MTLNGIGFKGLPIEVLNAVPLSCICWDVYFNPVYCNDNAVRLFGAVDNIDLTEHLRMLTSASQPLSGAEKRLSTFNLQNAFNRGHLRIEITVKNFKGVDIPIDATFRTFTYNDQEFILGSLRDVSGRVNSWVRTQETEQRLQILFDTTPMAITYWEILDIDPDGTVKDFKITNCNQEAVNIFGLTDKSEYIQRYFELSPVLQPNGDKSIEGVAKFLTATLKDGYKRFEWMHQKNDGEEIPSQITNVKIMIENKSMVASYMQDLREIKATMAKLQEADERTTVMLDAMPLCVNLWDRALNNVECNEEAVRLFDVPDKKTYLDRFFELSPDHQPDGSLSAHKSMEMVVRAFNEGYCRFNWMHKKLNGERIPTEITLTRVKYKEDYMVAGYTRDLREHEAMLREMRRGEIAEESNKLKNKFLATISHEIRSPMNAIMGITEIQLLKENLPEDTRDALNRIFTSSNLLLHIVNDLLDLSKIEAGKLELMINTYQTASLINDSVQMNVLQYESKPIEFKLRVNENIPASLSGDELRIKQIVNNLLSNAFKYTDKGSITMTVSVDNSQKHKDCTILVFEVRDTGQGMTKSQVNRLFDEYSRFNTEANRLTVGAGLGMSITRNLIKMMDGSITVDSTPGKGSTFVVHLPQRKAGDHVIGREIADNLEQFRFNNPIARLKLTQIVRDPMPYGRVLLVDDMETNLYVGKGLLSPYGIQVDTAISGYEAINKIESGQTYDVIFMDHMMPKMDGIETTKIIRSMGYQNTIIALTANAVVGQAEVFLQNGINGFIPKPIDTRELNQALNKYIRDKQPPEVIEAARKKKKDFSLNDSDTATVGPQLIQSFLRDAEKTMSVMQEVFLRRNDFSEEDIKNHIIHAHAIKSALANMGEAALSKRAALLEEWGRAGNMNGIFSEIPGFLRELREYIDMISPKKQEAPADQEISLTDEDIKKWSALKEACLAYDKKAAKALVSELSEVINNSLLAKRLNDISQHLLHSAFAEAAEVAEVAEEVLK